MAPHLLSSDTSHRFTIFGRGQSFTAGNRPQHPSIRAGMAVAVAFSVLLIILAAWHIIDHARRRREHAAALAACAIALEAEQARQRARAEIQAARIKRPAWTAQRPRDHRRSGGAGSGSSESDVAISDDGTGSTDPLMLEIADSAIRPNVLREREYNVIRGTP